MKKITTISTIILIIAGAVFSLMVVLSFTTAPFWIWYNLGKKSSGIHRPPDFIVVMGGGGMPSESGLIRCWYAAKTANHFNRSKVIVALPGDTSDPKSSINAMKAELLLRGISPGRILVEDSGSNTRGQALNIFQLLSPSHHLTISPFHHLTISPSHHLTISPSLLIVTSPEHLHRAVLSFRKAGFTRVDGQAAWEHAIESDLNFYGNKLGGRKIIPDIGENLSLRYEFWTQMNYELLVLREWLALGYYKLKGWI
jgi:uncharacterized SAM-binding protein YcdF (DUF218 family)